MQVTVSSGDFNKNKVFQVLFCCIVLANLLLEKNKFLKVQEILWSLQHSCCVFCHCLQPSITTQNTVSFNRMMALAYDFCLNSLLP